jgi:hypothetical protein
VAIPTLDFRSNRRIPVETIVDVMGKDPLASALQAGTTGLKEGITLNETIRKLRNKRKAAKYLAQTRDWMSPELAELAVEEPSIFRAIENNEGAFQKNPEGQWELKPGVAATEERVRTLGYLQSVNKPAREPFTVDALGNPLIQEGQKLTAAEVSVFQRAQNLAIARKRLEMAEKRMAAAKTTADRRAAAADRDAALGMLRLMANPTSTLIPGFEEATAPLVPEAVGTVADYFGGTPGTITPEVTPDKMVALKKYGEGQVITFDDGEMWVLQKGKAKYLGKAQ